MISTFTTTTAPMTVDINEEKLINMTCKQREGDAECEGDCTDCKFHRVIRYETKIMADWLTRTKHIHDNLMDTAEYYRHEDTCYLADAMQEFVMQQPEFNAEFTDVLGGNDIVASLLRYALDQVDWYILAEFYHDNLKPEVKNRFTGLDMNMDDDQPVKTPEPSEYSRLTADDLLVG